MEKEKNDIELFDVSSYGDELRVVMTTPPKWPIRWGVLVVFIVFLVMLGISYFVRYPEIVNTSFTLTSNDPSIKIVPTVSGRIKLLVTDGQVVTKGKLLGYIENTADPAAFSYYMTIRDSIEAAIVYKRIASLPEYRVVNFGELQDQYITLLNHITEYRNYARRNDLMKSINLLNDQGRLLEYINGRIRNEYRLNEARRSLGEQKLQRDSLLYQEMILSKQEYEDSKSNYIPYQLTAETIDQSLKSNQARIVDLESKKADLTLQHLKYLENLESAILSGFNDLEKGVLLWKEKYLFEAPIPGRVTLFEIRDDNQYVAAEKEFLNITPVISPVMLGYSTLPVESSGKVKVGQRVTINLSNYPAQQYGFIEGIVKSISTLPKEGNYYVAIELPGGLKTNMNKPIEYREQMVGTAGIVTEDLRLLERFFYNFRKLIQRQ